MFGDVPAVGNTHVASPDVSNHELNNEPAGQVFILGNLVPKSGGNTDDGSQVLTDVHGDPVDDLGSYVNESSVLSQVESFENVNNSEHNKDNAPHYSELSPEQTDVVEQTCQAMSTAQREHIANREHAVIRLQAKNAKSSCGKAIELRNWGVANLILVKTDVDIQQAMLDEFNNMAQQAINKHDEEPETSSAESIPKTENTAHRKKDNQSVKQYKAQWGHSVLVPTSQGMENLIDRVAGSNRKPSQTGKKRRDEDKAMQPVKHITDDSALRWAFKCMDQGSDDDTPDNKSLSDSSSDPSESESSESSDDNSSLSNLDDKTKRHCKHSKKSKLRSLLKPIPPEKYNGAADL